MMGANIYINKEVDEKRSPWMPFIFEILKLKVAPTNKDIADDNKATVRLLPR